MGTTVTERFEVVLRNAETGKVITGIFGAATAEDCAKTAAVNGVATQLASWQTLDWKKQTNDALWTDPASVIEYTEDPDSSTVFEALVMKQVTTVVDESTVQSTQVEWVPAFT